MAENRGGRFVNSTATSTTDVVSWCTSMVAGDFDQDLQPEWITTGTQVPWMTEQRDGLLETFWFSPIILIEQFEQQAALFDMDLDGLVDMLISPSSRFDPTAEVGDDTHQEGLWVFRSTSEANPGSRIEWLSESLDLEPPLPCFDEPNPARAAALRYGAESFVVDDFDLDGDEDIFLPMPSTTCGLGPGWYDNRAQQGEVGFVFRPFQASYGALLRSTAGTAADLDRDGDLDIIMHNWGTGRIAVFENVLNERRLSDVRPLRVAARTDPDGDATDPDTSDDRWARGLVIDFDLDGPNFDYSRDRIRSRVIGGGASHGTLGPPERIFGRPDSGPIWVRTRFADGSITTLRVEEFEREVILVDCAEAECS